MPRLILACFCAFFCALPVFSADPQTPLIERQLAVQNAMVSARKYLDAKMPVEAVAALEKELSNADGSKAYLNLLREAYLAELYQLENTPNANPDHLTQTRRSSRLLDGQPPKDAPTVDASPALPKVPPATLPDLGPSLAPPAPPEMPTKSVQPTAKPADAVAQFKQGNFSEADRLFGTIGAVNLSVEQKTAWAYCRIKLAADRVNAPNCDAATAAAAVQSVGDAASTSSRTTREAPRLRPRSAEGGSGESREREGSRAGGRDRRGRRDRNGELPHSLRRRPRTR